MDTKVVRRPGTSATRPVDLDRVWIHFTGTYVVGTEEERPFASCVMGEDPFSIILGQDQTIVGLEILLKSMTEGEVAGVRLPPDMCFGAGGNPHKFHGRGEPIPPNASLIFEVQLVAFEPTAQLSERAAAPLTERFAFAANRKLVANEAFRASLLPKAIVLYSQCIALIEDSRDAAHKDLQAQLHSNLAACKARFGRWREVIALCTVALTHDANHAKSLFRRGRAYLSTGKYEEARADLRRAAEVEPNDKEIKSELKRLEDLLSRMQMKEKTFAQNMVQGIKEAKGPLVPERPPDPEEQFTKCNICGNKVEKVQLARHVIKAHSEAAKDA